MPSIKRVKLLIVSIIMSKILKVVLVSIYSALFFHYIEITIMGRNEDSIELEYVFRQPGALKKIRKEIREFGANVTLRKLKSNFRQPERLPTDIKFILKWTEAFCHHGFSFPNGQTAFVENKCEFYNCFMTSDKSLLPDVRNFDAILFDVENDWENHPLVRSLHQYYILAASEPASSHPVCHPYFEFYYNLTWTYKLDSDIRWSYVTILDKYDKFVGPKINMTWINPMKPTSESVIKKLTHKRKLIAWFVSTCRAKSKREKVATTLSAALSIFGQKIDIYGWCGELSCPKDRMEECFDLLQQEYYFYLSFENALSDDYVTENILHPLMHFTVPIVYGGANYSRFLPPGSYLDARQLNATEIALKMIEATRNPAVYYDYFRWHNHYKYKGSPEVPDICTLCKTLNDPALGQRVVKNFRQWWYPNYTKECAAEEKRINFHPQ